MSDKTTSERALCYVAGHCDEFHHDVKLCIPCALTEQQDALERACERVEAVICQSGLHDRDKRPHAALERAILAAVKGEPQPSRSVQRRLAAQKGDGHDEP